MKFKRTSLAIACGFAVSMTAQAGYLSVDETAEGQGTFELDQSINDYVANVSSPAVEDGDTVYTGYQVNAAVDGPFRLTFDYLYKESAATTRFFFENEELFATRPGLDGEKNESASRVFYGNSSEPLNFSFAIDGGVTVNNSDNDDGMDENFFVDSISGEDGTLFDSLILGWDDGGGKGGDDDNHDDMIIKVTASKVPEPGTLALLGLGLAGLGMSYRRRS